MNAKMILRLVFTSLLVGFVMHKLDITPKDFWLGALDKLSWVWENTTAFFEWGLIYIITGAAIVVPIFIIDRFLKLRKERRRSANKDSTQV